MVDPYGTVEDGPVPVLAYHLLPCELGAGHLDGSAPGASEETVGDLSFGGGCNNIGLVVADTSKAISPHYFLVGIGVGVELTGEMAYVRAELGEGVDDLV